METPISLIINYLNTINIKVTKQLWQDKEKEFAKQCFEAGRKFGMDNSHSIEWGEDTTQPDFDNWFKQFEQ